MAMPWMSDLSQMCPSPLWWQSIGTPFAFWKSKMTRFLDELRNHFREVGSENLSPAWNSRNVDRLSGRLFLAIHTNGRVCFPESCLSTDSAWRKQGPTFEVKRETSPSVRVSDHWRGRSLLLRRCKARFQRDVERRKDSRQGSVRLLMKIGGWPRISGQQDGGSSQIGVPHCFAQRKGGKTLCEKARKS